MDDLYRHLDDNIIIGYQFRYPINVIRGVLLHFCSEDMQQHISYFLFRKNNVKAALYFICRLFGNEIFISAFQFFQNIRGNKRSICILLEPFHCDSSVDQKAGKRFVRKRESQICLNTGDDLLEPFVVDIY